MRTSSLLLTTFAALMLLLLTGCDRVTRENYAKIETGMTLDEVVKVLGEPTKLDSVGIGPLEASTARWEGRDGVISIQFTGQKVRIKRFLAPEKTEQQKPDAG